jgi:signal transduction histidine kinase
MLGKVSGDQKGALSTIGTSTEQLILLVNHLLDLTRIESGRLQVKIEPVDVDQIVSWIVDFVRPKATEKKLEIVWKPERSHLVKADPEKLKEVLMNITDNAIKYTEQGKVTLTVSESGPHVSVAVSDTGYGLTAQDQKRMFEKFATGSASKNVKTTSGIGLYVVKKLMEAMGGSIKAESRGSGKGSTFTATFPKA